ncbi:MAG: biotin/lipoyl-binding protein, partial [Alphaproteobacteria bacterium]|nr:biotin/lipoyl-binding protein [Alphaproteobacteria bacterium]
MAIEIKMPALSPTMTSGTLAKWLVGEGDQVNSGDVIAEIETDKATMEVESVDDGVMAKILIQAGSENVAVGAVIAMLAADGESVSDVANMNPQPEKLAASASAVETPTAPVQTTAPVTPATPAISQPAADKPRLFASPLARRIAADKGISLEGITGSGPYGRILRRDVEAAPAEPASTYIAPVAQAIGQADGHLRGGSDLVANSQMRKVIAGRLQESKQQAPHFYLTVD